jgi:predicted secreted acid phosphatase
VAGLDARGFGTRDRRLDRLPASGLESRPQNFLRDESRVSTCRCSARTATLRNLQALRLPNAAEPGALSLRRERPEWESSDKTVRRKWIAESYRIVALVGDDLRDFVDRPIYAARAAELAPLLGTRWFLLPNSMYGSWERGITAGACTSGMSATACAEATTRKRYEALKPDPSAGAATSR